MKFSSKMGSFIPAVVTGLMLLHWKKNNPVPLKYKVGPNLGLTVTMLICSSMVPIWERGTNVALTFVFAALYDQFKLQVVIHYHLTHKERYP